MTVRELIEALQAVEDQEALVVLQKDAEGNGYSPLDDDGVTEGAYIPGSTWYGEVYLLPQDLDDEAREQGFTEDDVATPGQDGAVAAVVLVPIN